MPGAGADLRGWGSPRRQLQPLSLRDARGSQSCSDTPGQPQGECETFVLAAPTFPLPVRASQGLSLLRSLAEVPVPLSSRGTGQIPHSASSPPALPALGLPSPVWRWLPGRWPDPRFLHSPVHPSLLGTGFQVSKGFIGHPAAGDESALPAGQDFRAGKTGHLPFPREASALALAVQMPTPGPLASRGLLGARGRHLPTLGVVLSRTFFPPSSSRAFLPSPGLLDFANKNARDPTKFEFPNYVV